MIKIHDIYYAKSSSIPLGFVGGFMLFFIGAYIDTRFNTVWPLLCIMILDISVLIFFLNKIEPKDKGLYLFLSFYKTHKQLFLKFDSDITSEYLFHYYYMYYTDDRCLKDYFRPQSIKLMNFCHYKLRYNPDQYTSEEFNEEMERFIKHTKTNKYILDFQTL